MAFWEAFSVFFKDVVLGRLTMFQWRAKHPEVYDQHKLESLRCLIQKKKRVHKVGGNREVGKICHVLRGEPGDKYEQNALYKVLKELFFLKKRKDRAPSQFLYKGKSLTFVPIGDLIMIS